MLLAAFFILGFGMCAGRREALFMPEKLNSTQLFKRSLNVLRNKTDLHLLMFSSGMSDIPKCLISRYVKRIKDRTYRTLETNKEVQSKKMYADGEITTIRYNISIVVERSDPPFFDVTFEGGWSDHCTLWGYTTCNSKCLINCQKEFVEKCRIGIPIYLTDCAKTEVEKGPSKRDPK
uniref:Putative secreted protein 94 n=1 Tax=Amblyomma parvum TaxID=251391 RepID=A0A023FXT8_AMBPA